MKKINALIWGAIQRAGLEKEMLAALVLEEFKKILVEKFGEKILHKVKVLHLKNQILALSIISSVVAHEIKLNEAKLLKKINQKFGQQVIERLRFLAH